jgi:hypothetical protein
VVATEQPFSVADITVSSWSFAIRIGLATILASFVSFKASAAAPPPASETVTRLF